MTTTTGDRAPDSAGGHGQAGEGAPADGGAYAALQAFEGRPSGPPAPAPDPVNQAMIRHWVEAMGDENPVYLDEEAARAAGFSGIVAPATMLQAWIMRGYKASAEVEAARAEGRAPADPTAMDELFTLLDSMGCTSIVATNCEQRYHRPLVLGDRLTMQSTIESISPRKRTALGDGYFVTTLMAFSDDGGAEVATMRFRVFKFAPRAAAPGDAGAAASEGNGAAASAGDAGGSGSGGSGGAGPAARPRRPRPAITRDLEFFFEGTRNGELLVQRCGGCGTLRHPPLPACPHCRSLDWHAVPVAGTGTVFSFVVVHHPQVPAFDYPLPIAVVALDEGVRMVGQLVGVAPADVRIGMPVAAELTAVDDELTLPFFRPREVPS